MYFELQLIDGKKCEAGGLTAIGLPFSIPIYMGEAFELYRARLWGVCCCALRLRFLFFDRQGRGVLNTPHQTSPTMGRMRVPGYFAGQFIGGIRALPCLIVGRMQYAPTLPVDCMGSFCQPSDL